MEENEFTDYKIIICEGRHLIQHNLSKKMLEIQSSPFKISNYNSTEAPSVNNVINNIFCHAIIGILTIRNMRYLVYAKKVENIGKIKQKDIFEIKEVEFLDLSFENESENDDYDTIQNIRQFLSTGFYYSYVYDLTNSLEKQYSIEKRFTNKTNVLLQIIDKNYYWNLALYKEFILNEIDQVFFCILIYGYIGINNYKIKESEDDVLTFSIISRKLIQNSDKILFSTGLNNEGHVANYIQTEQIMIFKHIEFSFIQARGSCPIFYKINENSNRDKLEVEITKRFTETRSLFIKHLMFMSKDIIHIHFLNCLNSKKEHEKKLLTELENLQKNSINNCQYDTDDFEIDEQNNFTHILDTIILSLDKSFQCFNFFCYDSKEKEPKNKQMGMIRTICFDTNTKTNHIQRKISYKIFENFINHLFTKINIKPFLKENSANSSINLQDTDLLEVLDSMWIKNGRNIENIYGIENLYSKTKELKEYSLKFSNDINEIVLGNDKIVKDLLCYVGTWNFAGKELKNEYKINDWLLPKKNTITPDIYIIGIQEIVNLEAKNIMLSSLNMNAKNIKVWETKIVNYLREIDNYTVLKTLDLVGIYMIVLVKDKIKSQIRNSHSDIMKTGFLKLLGNKGNVIFRFDLNELSFAVSCCHLASDIEKNDSRIKDMIGIMNRLLPTEKNHKDHDVMILFGDLNYRLELENNLCRKLIKEGNLLQLSKKDQFNKAKVSNKQFHYIEEGPLNFNPTYKFNFNTNDYDTSKKNRTPAWCDRVFWKKNNCINLLNYDSVNYTYSDHKPVYAIFRINSIKNHPPSLSKNSSFVYPASRNTISTTDQSKFQYYVKKSCKNIFKTNLYGDEYFTQSIDNLNYNYNSIVDDKQFDKHNKNSSLNYIEDYISENKKIKNDIQKEKIEIPNEDATRISENLKENSNLDIISQSDPCTGNIFDKTTVNFINESLMK